MLTTSIIVAHEANKDIDKYFLMIYSCSSNAFTQDMYIYVDSHPTVRFEDESRLVWFEESIPLADASNEIFKDVEIFMTDDMRYQNSTLYVHCQFARTGISPNPESDEYDKLGTFGATTSTF